MTIIIVYFFCTNSLHFKTGQNGPLMATPIPTHLVTQKPNPFHCINESIMTQPNSLYKPDDHNRALTLP